MYPYVIRSPLQAELLGIETSGIYLNAWAVFDKKHNAIIDIGATKSAALINSMKKDFGLTDFIIEFIEEPHRATGTVSQSYALLPCTDKAIALLELLNKQNQTTTDKFAIVNNNFIATMEEANRILSDAVS